MGQQPNIELEMADLPRPTSKTAPARRWSPNRPGELSSPGDVPWGGAFGTPGPDTGYALRLVKDRRLPLTDFEHRHDVDAGIAAIAGARASLFGRSPTGQDVDVASLLLGFDHDGLPATTVTSLEEDRKDWLATIAHDADRARVLVATLSTDVLRLHPDAIRSRMAAGDRLVG